MASVAVARFGGALRSSNAAFRTMRTIAGSAPAARAGWINPIGTKRCKSTVYAESHEYVTEARGPSSFALITMRNDALGGVRSCRKADSPGMLMVYVLVQVLLACIFGM